MHATEPVPSTAASPLTATLGAWPIEHSEELLAVIAAGGRLVHVSPAWERILGRPASELDQLPLAEHVHVDERTTVEAAFATVGPAGTELADLEHRYRHRDGDWRRLRWAARSDGTHWYALARDVTQRHDLERRALHDPLTGLPNRALLDDRLAQALAGLRRSEGWLALLFVDVDGLKAINDGLGHDAGDELLCEVARRLDGAVRVTDTVARIGGDEFLVVAGGLRDGDEIAAVADRLLAAFTAPLSPVLADVRLSASVGIAATDDAGTLPQELVRCADVAMYRAKARGGGCWVRFDEQMADEVAARLQAEGELRLAVARDELRVHYQPLVRLEDGVIVGCEAFVRWQHPQRGLVGPQAFVALAEENGLIVAIGAWVLDEACRQTAAWRRAGIDVPVSVNVAGRQLAHREFVPYVRATLNRHGVPGASLCLEIAEAAVMGRVERLAPVLAELKSLGVRLAMDDFGSGFSSLGHLRRLPVDVVKIDGSFVGAVAQHGPDRAIVAAILSLADEMGLTVIAEHIEHSDQLAALRRLGCPLGQGYHFARPRPAEELELTGFEPRGRPGFGDPFVIREFMRQIGIPARLDG